MGSGKPTQVSALILRPKSGQVFDLIAAAANIYKPCVSILVALRPLCTRLSRNWSSYLPVSLTQVAKDFWGKSCAGAFGIAEAYRFNVVLVCFRSGKVLECIGF